MFEIKGAGRKLDENEIILQLLSTMPESYQSVTTTIDIMFYQNQTAVNLDLKNKLLAKQARQTKNTEFESNWICWKM